MKKCGLNDLSPFKRDSSSMRTKKTVEKVIMPNPPIWKRKMVMTWPKTLRSLPISMTTRPVTQTEEQDVNRASTKRRSPFDADEGSQRRIPPARITAAKLKTKIRVGDKCLEKKVLTLSRIVMIKRAILISLKMKLTLLRQSAKIKPSAFPFK